MKKQHTPRKKHIPERTCIACRTKRPKRALVRVVQHAETGVLVDETGKSQGRGAYLCRQRRCWHQALKRGALSRTLRITLTPADIAALQAYAQSLPDFVGTEESTQEE